VSVPVLDPPSAGVGLRSWSPRRWAAAAGAAVVTALMIGLPTDVIPNPVFGRPVEVTWWSLPVLVVTSVLAGLLVATYVREPEPGTASDGTGSDGTASERAATDGDEQPQLDRTARAGGIGGLLAFFAVGCPVCNKVVLLALGTTGAMELFAPLQPLLAVVSVVVMAVALRVRLRNERACPLPG
jgi:hypothetical protein